MEILTREKYEEMVHELYVCLCKDLEIKPHEGLETVRERAFVSALVSTRSLRDVDANLNEMLTNILKFENKSRGVIMLDDLTFRKGMAFVVADPFVFEVDLLLLLVENVFDEDKLIVFLDDHFKSFSKYHSNFIECIKKNIDFSKIGD